MNDLLDVENIRVQILATGGTIDKNHDPINEEITFLGKSYIPEMLDQFRAKGIAHKIIMLKDSLDMTDEDRKSISVAVSMSDYDAIVITHGTSTMPETARYLKKAGFKKTIVLTGAMRPHSLYQSDAGFNLGSAVTAAQALPHGVYITMNGSIFEADYVRKNVKKGIFEEIPENEVFQTSNPDN